LDYFSLGETGDGVIDWLAFLATAGVIVWGSINSAPEPAAARS
jgi:hypothetical protein